MNKSTYYNKSLERDSILFKWKSDSLKLPYNPEFYLTEHGSIGYLIKEKKWVIGTFTGIMDEYGDFTTYVYHSLNTEDVQTGEATNHKDVIVCGNTILYRPFVEERKYYSEMKEETDKSILCQLLNTRLNKALVALNDKQKRQIEAAYEKVINGFPMIIVTSLLDDLQSVDLNDPREIDKMQYLSSFFQTMEKREANDFGIDLENLDKRAQVSTDEIKQYDDVTTMEYLIMYESRMRFVEEMKENGFELEIVRNPIFFDEPTKEDIETGEFEDAENSDQENSDQENEEGEENVDNVQSE